MAAAPPHAAPANPAAPSRARRASWILAGIVGLALTGVAWVLIDQREAQRHETAFERGASRRAHALQAAFSVHGAMLATAQGFFDAQATPSWGELSAFLASLLGRESGHAVVGWAPRVTDEGVAALVERRRADVPTFGLRRHDPVAGWLPAPRGREHAPVVVAAPGWGTAVLGWDLATEPEILRALEASRDASQPRVALLGRSFPVGPLADGRGSDAVLVQAVYARGQPRGTVEERRAATTGWAFVLFDPGALAASALLPLEPLGLDVYIFDDRAPARLVAFVPTRLGADDRDEQAPPRGPRVDHAALRTGLHADADVAYGGRTWDVMCVPAPAFLDSRARWPAGLAALAGLLLTALVAMSVRASQGREAAVRRAVTERTAALSVAVEDLRRENAERRRAEADLAAQTERLDVTLASIGDAVLTADADGRVDYLNRTAEALCGVRVDAARGRPLADVLRFEDERGRAPRPDVVEEMLAAEAATETAIPVVLVGAGGRERVVWPRWAPTTDEAGGRRGVVVALRDVTEARRAEQAVREREELFRVLSAELPYGLFLLDYDDLGSPGRIVHANEAAARMHGRTVADLLGRSVDDLAAPDVAEHVADRRRRVRAGETLVFEDPHRRADGTVFPVEVAMREIAWGGRRLVLALERDITERRRAEAERRRLDEQLQHAQRLESLGVLAGGIAHDFNNLLMGVLGNADLALLQLPPGSPAAGRVEDVKRAGQRAAELTSQLLAYAGKGRFVVAPLDLSALVRDTAKLLEVSVGRRARLVLDLADGLPAVEADAAQLRQVVMNLLTNAAEALGDVGGTVTLRTRVAEVDVAWLTSSYGGADLEAGRYVVLEVEDTGVGMDEATLRKIFEPFFTTKFTGRGLGLAALLGIVRGHGGAVGVRSAPGRGTTFRIVLPPSARTAPVAPSSSAPAVAASGRAALLLVVDDDDAVREVVARMLAGAGHRVLQAADGAEGVAALRAHADDVALVVLDLTMPGMSGEETLRALREVRPDVRVVVTSGYTQQDAAARLRGAPPDGFVQKPFDRADLLARIDAVLRAAAPGAPRRGTATASP
ncbi:MAG: PAS domain S-box protein [Planctomycetes bacterium]|nr:PAS domain S-box protein [Planctomycetota bacterium]